MTYQVLVQILADARRELHGADENKEYSEEHRKWLKHYRAHFRYRAGWNLRIHWSITESSESDRT